MRGLDTNVMVRYVTADDPAQTAVVKALFEGAEEAGERLFVSSIALCEVVWTLRGRPYSLSRREIATFLEGLLGAHLFELQDRDLLRQALLEYRKGRADFSDYMLGCQNRRAGCDSTLTCDRQLRGASGFSLLA
jgi:predicted nucleic-acid-binding protein